MEVFIENLKQICEQTGHIECIGAVMSIIAAYMLPVHC